MKPTYRIHRASGAPIWSSAEKASLVYHKNSGEHRPTVEARLLYDDLFLHVSFRVQADRAIKAVAQNYQDMVCRDSCVEFFVQPKPEYGYFNFEVNAGGVLLLRYTLGEGAPTAGVDVPADRLRGMQIHHSLPSQIDPELDGPIDWTIEYAIPLALFEHYTGPLGPLAGQTWRGNFYKCADKTSLPHWGMWADIGEKFSFHQTAAFGDLIFEP